MTPALEAILAAPGDDAPRLVWADEVGGERGELVVVQCTLARRDLPRPERKRLVERERELLKRAWTFSDLPSSVRGTWVRGFIEAVSLEVRELAVTERLFEFAPLCRFLELRDSESINSFVGPRADEAWATLRGQLGVSFARLPPDRITGLSASASVIESGDWNDPPVNYRFGDDFVSLVAETPAFSSLEELFVYDGDLTGAATAPLSRLPRLERLCGSMKLTGTEASTLLAQLPRLRRFAPWSSALVGPELDALLASPHVARLDELDLTSNTLTQADLERIAACAQLKSLRSLGLGYAKTRLVAPIASSSWLSSLEELSLQGMAATDLPCLAKAPFASTLRTLVASPMTLGDAEVAMLTALPALEHLVVHVIDRAMRERLEAVIPRLVG